jgi:hypothetical protein
VETRNHVRSGHDKMGVMQGEGEPRKPVEPPGALPDGGTAADSKLGLGPDPASALGTTVRFAAQDGDNWPEQPIRLLRRYRRWIVGCVGLLLVAERPHNPDGRSRPSTDEQLQSI